MRKGKTNQGGRVEYGAAMRCKEVTLCPLNAVAMYLFWRWHVDLLIEPFPDLLDRKRWYGMHLLKGADPRVQLSYSSQVEAVRKAFKVCGIDSSVLTHANRTSAAKLAELNGADEAPIRRAGRWNIERMESCYLTTLPRKAVRALAGFPTKGGSYWLARASITPPPSLLRAVFPGVEETEEKLRISGQKEIAASGFLRMLLDLRVVLLQDSVLFRRQFPRHSIWKAPVFMSLEYAQFESEVLKALHIEQPQDIRIETAMPLVAGAMKAGFDSIHGKLHKLESDLHSLAQLTTAAINRKVTVTSGESAGLRSQQPTQKREQFHPARQPRTMRRTQRLPSV